MGTVHSYIRSTWLGVKALFNALSELNSDFAATLDRINSPPGLPVLGPTTCFWQDDPPFPALVDVQSDELPGTADIVIIGSGITGASVAWTLLREAARIGIKRRVVMLEARQLCSGATGRNGGHIKVEPHSEFVTLKARFGEERARKILEFRILSAEILVNLAGQAEFDLAECRAVETVDLYFDQDVFKKKKESVLDLAISVPDLVAGLHLWDGAKARQVCQVP
jgi:hypothetical protein